MTRICALLGGAREGILIFCYRVRAVTDSNEAKALGLNVKHLDHDDSLWQDIWRLYCRYSTDAQTEGYGKIFESSDISLRKM